jgi:surface adhesion protein
VAKLTATPSVTEGGEITYTITLTNKDGLPINNHSALTFTLSDGKTVITVPANGTVGTPPSPRRTTSTSAPTTRRQIDRNGQRRDVGKFEQLTLDKTPVSTTVTDEPGTPRQATKATWSRSPSPPTRPRWPRTSNRPSPCTSTSRWTTTWS